MDTVTSRESLARLLGRRAKHSGPLAHVTFQQIVAAIHHALHKTRVDDGLVARCVVLTLKAEDQRDGGVHAELKAFGLSGGVSGLHTSENGHTITATFDPRPEPAPPTDRINDRAHNEFIVAFESLREMLAGASRQGGDGPPPLESIEVGLDFVVSDDFKISLVASGGLAGTSTHHVDVKFGRPAASPQQ